MNTLKVTPIKPWKFGELCDGCGAPNIPNCPTCGADLFQVGHGAIEGCGLPPGYKLTVCADCIDVFNAGYVPGAPDGYVDAAPCE